MNHADDKAMLDLAARLAWRAVGYVEPNPLVGCVIVRPGNGPVEGRIIGMGHHRQFGSIHAEVDALEDCRRRGHDPKGATVYVTLEPCSHTGHQPPCTDAIIGAKIARVVIARRDPNPVASGGVERLTIEGIQVEVTDVSEAAIHASDAFVKRMTTGLPWVVAKWAQTIDGKVATRNGESQWISNERSRARVHRLRARVDAIISGIGTVLKDDPMLTARGTFVRRVAKRVIIDPKIAMPMECKLVQSAHEVPVILATTAEGLASRTIHSLALEQAGVEIMVVNSESERIYIRDLLTRLVTEHEVSVAMIESGPGVLGTMMDEDLVDEAQVYIAPMMMADDQAKNAAFGRIAPKLAAARRFTLDRVKRLDDDVLLMYRRDARTPATA